MRLVAAIAMVACLVSSGALAVERWCHPADNTARVLVKPHPNAIHPNWLGESFIGTAWSLQPKRVVMDQSFTFIQGDLYSPRGGLVEEEVYILPTEWVCN